MPVECTVCFELHVCDAIAEHGAETIPVKAEDTDEVCDDDQCMQKVFEDNS